MFREILEFNPIYYNEVTYYLEMKWNRKLSDHEKNILIEGYRYGKTMQMLDSSLCDYHKQRENIKKQEQEN